MKVASTMNIILDLRNAADTLYKIYKDKLLTGAYLPTGRPIDLPCYGKRISFGLRRVSSIPRIGYSSRSNLAMEARPRHLSNSPF